jgi:uncharacterized membrane protein
MAQTPTWILSLSYWLHMLATVTSVGGLAALVLIVLPITRRSMENEVYTKLVRSFTTRLIPIGWLSLAVLVVTGLIQMSANENYLGFLAIENPWAVAILLKHVVFGVVLLLVFYQAWSLNPALERAELKKRHGGEEDPEEEKLQRRGERLITLNLILGIAILLLTALARIS